MNAAIVLVLDAGMRPLRVESWQKAFVDHLLGKTEVLEWRFHDRQREVQAASGSWPLPSVVRVLSHFKRERVRVKFSRLNIYARDGYTCQYCGDGHARDLPGLTFDHVIPRSHGGLTTWENIVTACTLCNSRKANRTPAEAGMHLRRLPRKPVWLPSMGVRMDTKNLPKEWRPYWTAALDP